MTFDGHLLNRGFWLYVWEITGVARGVVQRWFEGPPRRQPQLERAVQLGQLHWFSLRP
jgi:hypothetical protein